MAKVSWRKAVNAARSDDDGFTKAQVEALIQGVVDYLVLHHTPGEIIDAINEMCTFN